MTNQTVRIALNALCCYEQCALLVDKFSGICLHMFIFPRIQVNKVPLTESLCMVWNH